MSDHPSRHDAHLLVAAIRILEHREKHPPDENELAALLQWHVDRVRVLAHGLDSIGAVSSITSPFDVRYKVGDHRRIDELEDAGVDESISREMEAYDQRSKAEQEKIERMFGSMPSAGKKDENSTDGLAKDFGDFERRKPANPFGDD